jgi:hypothetical protein
MTDAPKNTFDEITQAMINFAVDQGHVGADAPVWGQYEGYTRVALETLKRRFEKDWRFKAEMKSILEGKS